VLSQMVSGNATDQPVRPLPPGMKAPVVDFRDIAAQAGLTATVISGDLDQTYIVENTGTGVAIFDYDNDGLPDIFLVQGDRLHNSGPPLTPHLYHNLGGLHFEDVTAKAGIGHLGWGQGVCAGDADNDGHVDLFLTQWGHNVFLHNLGNGTFRDERRSVAFTGRNRDGAQDAPSSITTAMAISIWWWRTTSTSKRRIRLRRAPRAAATGKACRSPAVPAASKARR
jgi:hypothetical protein